MTRGSPIPDAVMLHVSFRIVKRGGRKEMKLPEGAAQPRRTDSAGARVSLEANAGVGPVRHHRRTGRARGIAPSYMTRVLRLTLLAPDIVEAILDGKQGPEVTLVRVLAPFPIQWSAQTEAFL